MEKKCEARKRVRMGRKVWKDDSEVAGGPMRGTVPIVRSCCAWKRLSVNCKRRQDFPDQLSSAFQGTGTIPTAVSPTMIYLKRNW